MTLDQFFHIRGVEESPVRSTDRAVKRGICSSNTFFLWKGRVESCIHMPQVKQRDQVVYPSDVVDNVSELLPRGGLLRRRF